jgi:hypothetical protein
LSVLPLLEIQTSRCKTVLIIIKLRVKSYLTCLSFYKLTKILQIYIFKIPNQPKNPHNQICKQCRVQKVVNILNRISPDHKVKKRTQNISKCNQIHQLSSLDSSYCTEISTIYEFICACINQVARHSFIFFFFSFLILVGNKSTKKYLSKIMINENLGIWKNI